MLLRRKLDSLGYIFVADSVGNFLLQQKGQKAPYIAMRLQYNTLTMWRYWPQSYKILW